MSKGAKIMTREKQKAEAIKRMKALKLMPQVIKDFEKKDKVYYSERQNAFFNAVLYWLDNEKRYVDLVKEFEKKHNALVYHCQLTHLEFGDCLTLLYVSDTEEEWPMDNRLLSEGYPMAYVYNLDDETCSEFGSVGIKPSMGGVARTA